MSAPSSISTAISGISRRAEMRSFFCRARSRSSSISAPASVFPQRRRSPPNSTRPSTAMSFSMRCSGDARRPPCPVNRAAKKETALVAPSSAPPREFENGRPVPRPIDPLPPPRAAVAEPRVFELQCPDIPPGSIIPERHAEDSGISPRLLWSGVPEGTLEFCRQHDRPRPSLRVQFSTGFRPLAGSRHPTAGPRAPGRRKPDHLDASAGARA